MFNSILHIFIDLSKFEKTDDNITIKENCAIGKPAMMVNGQRASSAFGVIDLLTDEDITDLMFRTAHRKLDQLEKDLKVSLAS